MRRRAEPGIWSTIRPSRRFSVRGSLFLAACACFYASSAVAGTISGTVSVVDKRGHKASDVAEAVVYLDGPKARTKPDKATITMKHKAFSPHLLVVPVGSTVDFPNNDPIYHNAFSVSGENHFDLELYKRPKSRSWTFEHPGIVRVFCNIHPQMSAIVVVRDNPYFTRPAADGSFTITDVPAGTYTLKGWHERGGEASIDVTVPAQGTANAGLVLDASGFKRLPHKNKFGQEYRAPSDDRY
jgi:plastocyanin